MLCVLFRQLNTSGMLPILEVGRLLQIADPYPFMAGRDMKYSQLRTVFQKSSPEVQRKILEHLAEGEHWAFSKLRKLTGLVDMNDVMDSGLKALDQVSRVLTIARKEASNGRRPVTADRAEELENSIDQAIAHLLEVRQVVSTLSKQTRRSA